MVQSKICVTISPCCAEREREGGGGEREREQLIAPGPL